MNRILSKEELNGALEGFKGKNISATINIMNSLVSFRVFKEFDYDEDFRKLDLIFKNYENENDVIYVRQKDIDKIYIDENQDYCAEYILNLIGGSTISLSENVN